MPPGIWSALAAAIDAWRFGAERIHRRTRSSLFTGVLVEDDARFLLPYRAPHRGPT